MFTIEKNDEKIGRYLRSVIFKKYESIRKFCIAYLELRDGSANYEEIRKLLNRFSQILKGRKRIQIDDLPFVTELLEISCEEILSAGRVHLPVSNHVTNYSVAFSHDREVWDRYMKREDNLFLNCDEYCKTIIDYALDFKNYDFIKYLMKEELIWLADLSDWTGFSYGVGTKIKRRDFSKIDTSIPFHIQFQDELRIRIIALAIENEDFDILDSLLAREIPELRLINMMGSPNIDFQVHRNDELIRSIATSNNKIIDYYSQEFVIKNQFGRDNTFLFPYIDVVIKTMLENKKNDSAELLIRRAIKHNKKTLSNLKELLNKASTCYKETLSENMDELLKKWIFNYFHFDSNNNLVSYYYIPEKHKPVGFVTNIIHVDTKLGTPLIKELLNELNGIFEQIVSLNREV